MQNLKVALVQANQIWENKEANLQNYDKLLAPVAAVDLILLPEMFHTGFSMNAEELAEKMNNSIGLDWLKKIAKEKNSAIYTSLIIEENKSFFNRGVFVFPTGKMEIYDKRKLFGLAGEDTVFSSGEKEIIVPYKGWNFQLQICYDLRFPENSRNKITADFKPKYDAVLYVANWPDKRIAHWDALLSARAIENQCTVLAVNRVGVDGKKLEYSGHSCVIDALGIASKGVNFAEEVLLFEMNKAHQDSILKSLPFLKDI